MTTTPSITELSDQLASAQQRKVAAEEQLGAAVLDGGKVKTIEKNLAEAKADVDRLAAALETAEEREIEKGEQEAQEAARQERIALYTSVRDYLPLAAAVVEARAVLKAAEEKRTSFTLHRRAGVLLRHGAEGDHRWQHDATVAVRGRAGLAPLIWHARSAVSAQGVHARAL